MKIATIKKEDIIKHSGYGHIQKPPTHIHKNKKKYDRKRLKKIVVEDG